MQLARSKYARVLLPSALSLTSNTLQLHAKNVTVLHCMVDTVTGEVGLQSQASDSHAHVWHLKGTWRIPSDREQNIQTNQNDCQNDLLSPVMSRLVHASSDVRRITAIATVART